MRNVVVTDIERTPLEELDALATYGVATVGEAQGRVGYLGPDLLARLPGARMAGSLVTAVCWPGDNLMIHTAVEQCGPGDVLLVTTTSPCTDEAHCVSTSSFWVRRAEGPPASSSLAIS